VSEHGRGTFVRDGGEAGGGLGELVERTAREARRRRVDPRELAAMLYARAETGAVEVGGAEGRIGSAEEVAERRALRAEIEALEHELATLEGPRPAAGRGPGHEPVGAAAGARLVSALELAAPRDALAERVSARRAELRGARAAARRRALEPAPRPRPEPGAAWPELLAGAAGLRARRA
jgi:hypothetical protein